MRHGADPEAPASALTAAEVERRRSQPHRFRVRRNAGDAGFTLVELLVTISIMGIGFAAILNGLNTMFMSGEQHRKLAVAETALRTDAEQVDAAAYAPCATTSSYGTFLAAPPSGYTAQITAIDYWNGDGPSATFGSTCTVDKGAQRITLQVATTSTYRGVSQSVVVVKRDPS